MFWNTAVPSRPLRPSSQPVFMKLRHAGVFYLAPPADFVSDQREATRNVAGGRREVVFIPLDSLRPFPF